ncbi:hypothetical protein [Paracoccus endophyticus]|uniref:hypothetical protein n=1 Tax=Paracoccus endophyticus TaxID=2233774 RepID=UPI000DD95155|nr:hypothetical protein [Paracoccus endophyticus]
MLRMLRTSAAIAVTASLMAAPLAAQTAAPGAPAAQPTAPVVTAPETLAASPAPAAALPQALTDLGITDATVSAGKRGGQRVRGTLPGGAAFQGALDDQGVLRMLRATGDGAALPADVIAQLVPQAIRNAPVFAEVAQIAGVARGEQGVMVFGSDSTGQPVRAAFSADGTLQRFGRGDDDRARPLMRGDDDDRGPGHGHGHGKDRREDHGRERGRPGDDDRSDWRRGEGRDRPAMGQPGMGQPPQPLTDDAVRSALADAGYTQPGAIAKDGPRTTVEATNPEGEPVTVTVNPRGIIVREEAR